MMLRLVLVGAVAALGVSVPGEPSCEHWYDSAQAWATSLLAEWDTWTAVDESEPRLPMTANHMACEECRLARMRLVAKANENLRKDAVLAEAKPGANDTKNKPALADSKAAKATSVATDPNPFQAIPADPAFGPIAAIALNGARKARGDHGPISPANDSTSPGPVLSQPADAAELENWDELYQLANEPAPTAAQTDAFPVEDSDLSISEQSFICAFGVFDPADRIVPRPSIPAAERQSSFDMGVDLGESGGDVVSCLDEALSWDEEEEVVASAPRPDPFLADLPADVFVPEQVMVELSAPEAPSVVAVDAPLATGAPDSPGSVAAGPFLADLPSDVFVPMPQSSDPDSLAKDQPLAGKEPQPRAVG